MELKLVRVVRMENPGTFIVREDSGNYRARVNAMSSELHHVMGLSVDEDKETLDVEFEVGEISCYLSHGHRYRVKIEEFCETEQGQCVRCEFLDEAKEEEAILFSKLEKLPKRLQLVPSLLKKVSLKAVQPQSLVTTKHLSLELGPTNKYDEAAFRAVDDILTGSELWCCLSERGMFDRRSELPGLIFFTLPERSSDRSLRELSVGLENACGDSDIDARGGSKKEWVCLNRYLIEKGFATYLGGYSVEDLQLQDSRRADSVPSPVASSSPRQPSSVPQSSPTSSSVMAAAKPPSVPSSSIPAWVLERAEMIRRLKNPDRSSLEKGSSDCTARTEPQTQSVASPEKPQAAPSLETIANDDAASRKSPSIVTPMNSIAAPAAKPSSVNRSLIPASVLERAALIRQRRQYDQSSAPSVESKREACPEQHAVKKPDLTSSSFRQSSDSSAAQSSLASSGSSSSSPAKSVGGASRGRNRSHLVQELLSRYRKNSSDAPSSDKGSVESLLATATDGLSRDSTGRPAEAGAETEIGQPESFSEARSETETDRKSVDATNAESETGRSVRTGRSGEGLESESRDFTTRTDETRKHPSAVCPRDQEQRSGDFRISSNETKDRQVLNYHRGRGRGFRGQGRFLPNPRFRAIFDSHRHEVLHPCLVNNEMQIIPSEECWLDSSFENLKPMKDLEKTQFYQLVKRDKNLCSMIYPTFLQSYSWPAVLRMYDVFGIGASPSSHPTSDGGPRVQPRTGQNEEAGPPVTGQKVEGFTGGKTTSYLLPLLWLLNQTSSYASLSSECKDPIVIIVCPSSTLVMKIFNEVESLLGHQRDLPNHGLTLTVAYLFGRCDENKQQHSVKRGTNILVCTPHSLLRMFARGALTFSNLCHLVFEEADSLLENFKSQVLTIVDSFQLAMNNRKLHSTPSQLLVFSKQWSPNLDRFVGTHLTSPVVIVSSKLEAFYNGLVPVVAKYTPSSAKMEALVDIVFANLRDGKKKMVVCATTDGVALTVGQGLSRSFDTVALVTSSVDEKDFQLVADKWIFDEDEFIIVISDEALSTPMVQGYETPATQLSDVALTIHYDRPKKRTDFAERLWCMRKHFKKISEKQEKLLKAKTTATNKNCISDEVGKPPTSLAVETADKLKPAAVLLVSEADKEVAFAKVVLERSGCRTLPREMVELMEKEEEERGSKDPLCDRFKSFGFCSDLIHCRSRHKVSQFHDVEKDADMSLQLPLNVVVKIKLTYIKNPFIYYANVVEWVEPGKQKQPIVHSQALILAVRLAGHYSVQSSFKKVEPDNIEEGQLYIWKAIDGRPLRAKVLRLRPTNGGQVTKAMISLVDIGDIMTIYFDESFLYELHSDFKKIPYQAVEVCVCRLKPVDKDLVWNYQGKSFVMHLLNLATLSGRIVFKLGNTLWLDPLEECSKLANLKLWSTTLDVRRILLDKGFAEENPEHIELIFRASSHLIKVPDYVRSNKFMGHGYSCKGMFLFMEMETFDSAGDFVPVYLLAVHTPNRFYVQKISNRSRLEKLEQELNSAVVNQIRHDPEVAYKKDMLVLARNPLTDLWHRGKIMKVESNSPHDADDFLSLQYGDRQVKVTVLFLDTGELEDVSDCDLRPMPSYFRLALPFQSIECSLEGVEPPSIPRGSKRESYVEDLYVGLEDYFVCWGGRLIECGGGDVSCERNGGGDAYGNDAGRDGDFARSGSEKDVRDRANGDASESGSCSDEGWKRRVGKIDEGNSRRFSEEDRSVRDHLDVTVGSRVDVGTDSDDDDDPIKEEDALKKPGSFFASVAKLMGTMMVRAKKAESGGGGARKPSDDTDGLSTVESEKTFVGRSGTGDSAAEKPSSDASKTTATSGNGDDGSSSQAKDDGEFESARDEFENANDEEEFESAQDSVKFENAPTGGFLYESQTNSDGNRTAAVGNATDEDPDLDGSFCEDACETDVDAAWPDDIINYIFNITEDFETRQPLPLTAKIINSSQEFNFTDGKKYLVHLYDAGNESGCVVDLCQRMVAEGRARLTLPFIERLFHGSTGKEHPPESIKEEEEEEDDEDEKFKEDLITDCIQYLCAKSAPKSLAMANRIYVKIQDAHRREGLLNIVGVVFKYFKYWKSLNPLIGCIRELILTSDDRHCQEVQQCDLWNSLCYIFFRMLKNHHRLIGLLVEFLDQLPFFLKCRDCCLAFIEHGGLSTLAQILCQCELPDSVVQSCLAAMSDCLEIILDKKNLERAATEVEDANVAEKTASVDSSEAEIFEANNGTVGAPAAGADTASTVFTTTAESPPPVASTAKISQPVTTSTTAMSSIVDDESAERADQLRVSRRNVYDLPVPVGLPPDKWALLQRLQRLKCASAETILPSPRPCVYGSAPSSLSIDVTVAAPSSCFNPIAAATASTATASPVASTISTAPASPAVSTATTSPPPAAAALTVPGTSSVPVGEWPSKEEALESLCDAEGMLGVSDFSRSLKNCVTHGNGDASDDDDSDEQSVAGDRAEEEEEFIDFEDRHKLTKWHDALNGGSQKLKNFHRSNWTALAHCLRACGLYSGRHSSQQWCWHVVQITCLVLEIERTCSNRCIQIIKSSGGLDNLVYILEDRQYDSELIKETLHLLCYATRISSFIKGDLRLRNVYSIVEGIYDQAGDDDEMKRFCQLLLSSLTKKKKKTAEQNRRDDYQTSEPVKIKEGDTSVTRVRPKIVWFNEDEKTIRVKVDAQDVDPDSKVVEFAEDSVSFRATTSLYEYQSDLKLYGTILPDECTSTVGSGNVVLRLVKRDPEPWPRLTETKRADVEPDVDAISKVADDADGNDLTNELADFHCAPEYSSEEDESSGSDSDVYCD